MKRKANAGAARTQPFNGWLYPALQHMAGHFFVWVGQSGSAVGLIASKKVGDMDILRGLHCLYPVKPRVKVPVRRVEKVRLVVKACLDIVKAKLFNERPPGFRLHPALDGKAVIQYQVYFWVVHR